MNESVFAPVTISPWFAYPTAINTTATYHDSDGNISAPILIRDNTQPTFQLVVNKLIIFGIPAIIIVGFFGNTLSFMVFVCTHLRYQSCSVYLAFLNIVDIGFLLSLGIIWFEWLRMNLFHRHVMCQFIIYLSYVCAFLSSWTVVTFTIERYLVVFYPLKKHILCTPRRAKIIVAAISACALLLYCFSIWMNGIVVQRGIKMCIPLRKYYKVLQGVTALDTLITFLVPSLLIIVLNIGIVIKICDFIYGRGRAARGGAQPEQNDSTGHAHCVSAVGATTGGRPLGKCSSGYSANGSSSSAHSSRANNNAGQYCCEQSKVSGAKGSDGGGCNGHAKTPTATNNESSSSCTQCRTDRGAIAATNNKKHGVNNTYRHQYSHQSKRSMATHRQKEVVFSRSTGQKHTQQLPCTQHNYQMRTTRALVIVSSVYVLLNLPSHAFRAIACIIYLTDSTYTFPKNALIWQNVLQLLYYLNFASNVFLYSASSRSFRNALRRMLTRWRDKVRSGFSSGRLRARRQRLSLSTHSKRQTARL